MQEDIHKKHEGFNTPENVVFELVKKATGTNPIKRKKITAGNDNEVYSIETNEGKEFIVRIQRSGSTTFQQEKWAMEQCRAANVPVPEIFLIDTIFVEEIELDAMVLNKLDGNPLSELKEKLTDQELENILVEAGEILARIHSIKVGGFRHRNELGEWDFPDWKSDLHSSIQVMLDEKQFILDVGFSEENFLFMLEMMQRYKEEFHYEPVLCHGDYLPKHIFVSPALKICGIIDFGDFQGASPIHDLAHFDFEESKFDMASLRKGYGEKCLDKDKTFELEITLYKLMKQLDYLFHYRQQAEAISLALKETIKFLDILITSEVKPPKISYSKQNLFMPLENISKIVSSKLHEVTDTIEPKDENAQNNNSNENLILYYSALNNIK